VRSPSSREGLERGPRVFPSLAANLGKRKGEHEKQGTCLIPTVTKRNRGGWKEVHKKKKGYYQHGGGYNKEEIRTGGGMLKRTPEFADRDEKTPLPVPRKEGESVRKSPEKRAGPC